MTAAWPKRLLGGVSTSAHQIEGASGAGGRGPPIWDAWAKVPGRMRDAETGEPASGHHERWREDVALLRDLGARASRASITWPRVQLLARGRVNAAGLDFYDRPTNALCEAGILPVACLYHWDQPQALQDEGGRPARDIARRFADYAAICPARLADRIPAWATFDEPGLFTTFGHPTGGHPPGLKRTDAYLAAMRHVNRAHGGAARAILALRPDARLDRVHKVQPVRPAAADMEAAGMLGDLGNRARPDPQLLGHYQDRIAEPMEPSVRAGDLAAIRAPAAWVGVHHASPVYGKHGPSLPFGCAFTDAPRDGAPATPIDWRIEPGAVRDTLIDGMRATACRWW